MLYGPQVSVSVLSKLFEQLAKFPLEAFGVIVVKSRQSPRLVECAAAAVENKDNGHPKLLCPLVGFPPSDDAAEGGS